jgi:hypothetical protein
LYVLVLKLVFLPLPLTVQMTYLRAQEKGEGLGWGGTARAPRGGAQNGPAISRPGCQ